jgi:basic membrane lipoprotein Med (substrate-binding protein (PBP1-ABC) superfamily)
VLAAADMNVWTVPITVVKPSDTARNTTTTLADDPDLILPVAASSTYNIHGVIFYDGPSTADLKYTFSLPAAATGQAFIARQNVSGSFTGAFQVNWTDTQTANTPAPGVGTIMCLGVDGILAVAGTAGNMTFRWAQNSSNGTSCHVKAQSYLTAQRIT